ncbi:MAG: hypothetical protein COA78_32820 [Blastopirellula sp.]|nr:MAG: hypothetical protein COA78_32820 [Blastopirellula sp.]
MPPFVEVRAGGYLSDALFEAGPVKSDPMGGLGALEWVDIAAYVSLTGAISEPWEVQALRRMSAAYLRGMNEGRDPFSIAPVDRKE